MSNAIRAGVLAAVLPFTFACAVRQQPAIRPPSVPLPKLSTDSAPRIETTYQQDWALAIESANEGKHLQAMAFADYAAQKYFLIQMIDRKNIDFNLYRSEFGINPMEFYHDQLVKQVKSYMADIDGALAGLKSMEKTNAEAKKHTDFAVALEGIVKEPPETPEDMQLIERLKELKAAIENEKGAQLEFRNASANLIKVTLETIDQLIRDDASKIKPLSRNDVFDTLKEAGIVPIEFYALCVKHGARVVYPDVRLGVVEVPKAALGLN